MVFIIIDLLLPLWTLVWYFQRTVKESTYTSSSKMVGVCSYIALVCVTLLALLPQFISFLI